LSHAEADNVRSMYGVSSRRAANAVLAAGARLAAIKDELTDLSAIGRAMPLSPDQLAQTERLLAEEVEARRMYEEAVHRFRFLTGSQVRPARVAT
jgi:hypothetical protein